VEKTVVQAVEYIIANPLAVWGAILSTILGIVKLWEAFWKDRVRLATTYSLTGERGGAHQIVIANLSPLPVQVSHWTLAWEPRWISFWSSKIDVTPDETTHFKIDARNTYTLNFEGFDRFAWDWKAAGGRQLVLKLKLFGKRHPIKLVIGAGQEPHWITKMRMVMRRKCASSRDD